MAGAFTSCSEQGAELLRKPFGVSPVIPSQPCLRLGDSLGIEGMMPFPFGQFMLSLAGWPVYIAG